MIQALAPRKRRGYSWVWLSIVLACGCFPPSLFAQPEAKSSGAAKKSRGSTAGDAARKGASPKKDKDAEGKAADAEKKPAEEEAPAKKKGNFEVFKDPNAEEALKVFKSIPGFRPASPEVAAAVKNAAAGQGSADRDTIRRFVEGMAAVLIDRSAINALISPPPSGRPSRAIQTATDQLLDALNTAKATKNTAFLSTYNQELVSTLSKLLDNNLVSRTQAMIVLGQTASPAAMPTYIAQLKDPNQTVQVKIWSANGLAAVVDNGTKVDTAISAQEAINAAKQISDFLEREKDTFWFLQMRALEALGSMRQSAVPNNLSKAEMAVTAMKFLAKPDAKPEVRAAAAWALGMVRVNPAIARYNYNLVAYHIGLLAGEIGTEINITFGRNPTRARYLTSLLATPIYQAFHGVEGARESGLLKSPGAAPDLAGIRQIADLTSSVARSAVELIRAPNGQIPARKADLGEKVAGLKAYLEKNAPKDFHLVPSDPAEFRVNGAQVAGGPAGMAKAAGAPGGL